MSLLQTSLLKLALNGDIAQATPDAVDMWAQSLQSLQSLIKSDLTSQIDLKIDSQMVKSTLSTLKSGEVPQWQNMLSQSMNKQLELLSPSLASTLTSSTQHLFTDKDNPVKIWTSSLNTILADLRSLTDIAPPETKSAFSQFFSGIKRSITSKDGENKNIQHGQLVPAQAIIATLICAFRSMIMASLHSPVRQKEYAYLINDLVTRYSNLDPRTGLPSDITIKRRPEKANKNKKNKKHGKDVFDESSDEDYVEPVSPTSSSSASSSTSSLPSQHDNSTIAQDNSLLSSSALLPSSHNNTAQNRYYDKSTSTQAIPSIDHTSNTSSINNHSSTGHLVLQTARQMCMDTATGKCNHRVIRVLGCYADIATISQVGLAIFNVSLSHHTVRIQCAVEEAIQFIDIPIAYGLKMLGTPPVVRKIIPFVISIVVSKYGKRIVSRIFKNTRRRKLEKMVSQYIDPVIQHVKDELESPLCLLSKDASKQLLKEVVYCGKATKIALYDVIKMDTVRPAEIEMSAKASSTLISFSLVLNITLQLYNLSVLEARKKRTILLEKIREQIIQWSYSISIVIPFISPQLHEFIYILQSINFTLLKNNRKAIQLMNTSMMMLLTDYSNAIHILYTDIVTSLSNIAILSDDDKAALLANDDDGDNDTDSNDDNTNSDDSQEYNDSDTDQPYKDVPE